MHQIRLQHYPDSLAGFKGATSKEERRGREGRGKRTGRKKGKRRVSGGGEGRRSLVRPLASLRDATATASGPVWS